MESEKNAALDLGADDFVNKPVGVRVLMAQLRQKLETDPGSPQLLLTEPGIGYRLTCDDEG